MKARIIYIDPNTKTVRLSARLHVMELRAPNDLPALGVYMHMYTYILMRYICIIQRASNIYAPTCVYMYTCYSYRSRNMYSI